MTRKLLPFPGAESVLDPLTLESEMRIAALRAAHARPPQPTESWDPIADRLALYTDPPRRRSPLSAITVESFVASIRQAAQQLRQVPGVAAQARAADTLPALISPAEARLLQLLGGSGRIDRHGFRHFDNPALTPDPTAPDPTAFAPPTLYPPLDPNDLALNWPGTSGPPWSGPTASFPAIQPASNPTAPPAGSGGSQDAPANPGTTDPAAPASQPVQLPADGSGGGLLDRLLGIGTAQAQGIGSGRGRGAIRLGPGGNELSQTEEMMVDSYYAGRRELQAIEPGNQQLKTITPQNYVPNRSAVDAIWDEVAAARARAGRIVQPPILFGQRSVSPNFSARGKLDGRSIDDVAADLKSCRMSPDQLPVQVIIRNGAPYTINNRSLMALRLAGQDPTDIRDITGYTYYENALTQRLHEIGRTVGPDFIPHVRR